MPVTQKLQSAMSVLDELSDDDADNDAKANVDASSAEQQQQQQSRQQSQAEANQAPVLAQQEQSSLDSKPRQVVVVDKSSKVQSALNVLDNLSDEGKTSIGILQDEVFVFRVLFSIFEDVFCAFNFFLRRFFAQNHPTSKLSFWKNRSTDV